MSLPLTARGRFASFADLASHLEALGLFRMRPELGKLRQVLAALRPKKACAAVQIVGTNGKGSTATFLEALARTHNIRTGLFTSPHFLSFRERIRLDGLCAEEGDILAAANCVMDAGGESLTYFELMTAIASRLFTPERVDVAVWETGLGGRFDAVSALPVDMVAYTPIGLDHCRILGDSIAAIAQDKCGAIRAGKPVFSAPQHPDAGRELEEAAAAHTSPLFLTAGRESLPPAIRDGVLPLGLAGDHQYTNAALALAIWRYMAALHGWERSEDAETAALASAFIPGRMQRVPACAAHGHPTLLLDGAHNGHGMAALGENLARLGIAPAAVIFSCLEDKDPAAMAAHLRVLATGPIFVPPIAGNPRAMDPTLLAETVGLAAEPVASMAEALERARHHMEVYLPDQVAAAPERHPVLLCGSLYMLSDFFALRPDCLERRD